MRRQRDLLVATLLVLGGAMISGICIRSEPGPPPTPGREDTGPAADTPAPTAFDRGPVRTPVSVNPPAEESRRDATPASRNDREGGAFLPPYLRRFLARGGSAAELFGEYDMPRVHELARSLSGRPPR